jgi:hypothetical protein
MPERKCVGCKKQEIWGCEAKPHPAFDNESGEPIIDPKTQQQKVVWSKPARIPEIFDDEETFACPRQTLKENPQEWNKLLIFFAMFKEGFLPQAGAIADQSNRAMEILQILNTTNQECEDELMKREKAKGAKATHGKMGA